MVGYLRPVQQWNAGKKSEYLDRQVFGAPGEARKAKARDTRPLRKRKSAETLIGWGF